MKTFKIFKKCHIINGGIYKHVATKEELKIITINNTCKVIFMNSGAVIETTNKNDFVKNINSFLKNC